MCNNRSMPWVTGHSTHDSTKEIAFRVRLTNSKNPWRQVNRPLSKVAPRDKNVQSVRPMHTKIVYILSRGPTFESGLLVSLGKIAWNVKDNNVRWFTFRTFSLTNSILIRCDSRLLRYPMLILSRVPLTSISLIVTTNYEGVFPPNSCMRPTPFFDQSADRKSIPLSSNQDMYRSSNFIDCLSASTGRPMSFLGPRFEARNCICEPGTQEPKWHFWKPCPRDKVE
jgi:hypothetical protein